MAEHDYASQGVEDDYDWMTDEDSDIDTVASKSKIGGFFGNLINGNKEIPLTPGLAQEISKILQPVLLEIIQKSAPVDAGDVTGELATMIPKWRENILTNLNKLKETQSAEHGENFLFNKENAEFNKRENSINELNALRNDLRNQKRNKKSDAFIEEDRRMKEEVKNSERKEWYQIFKPKTEKQAEIEGERKGTIKQARKDKREKRKEINLMIGYLRDGVTDEKITIDKIPEEYQKHFDADNFRLPQEKLRGKMVGPVDRQTYEDRGGKIENRFDPFNDFFINGFDKKNIHFDFLGVKSIDDILPIFTPKAKTSVVDASESDSSYNKIKEIDTRFPNGELYNKIAEQMNEESGPNAYQYPLVSATLTSEEVGQYMLTMSDSQRSKFLTYYRKDEYKRVTTGNSSIDQSYIFGDPDILSPSEKAELSSEKGTWKDKQETDIKDDLNKTYADAYGLKIIESDWKEKYLSDDPDKKPKEGYDSEGNALPETARDFARWLKLYPPAGIMWLEKSFGPDTKEPTNDGTDHESYKTKHAAWKTKFENAEKWTKKVNNLDAGTETISGWEIDATKQDALTNYSINNVYEQKWTSVQRHDWSDDEEMAYEQGGQFKSSESSVTEDKELEAGGASVSSKFTSGTYRKTASKRSPFYDENTTYRADPNDPKFIAGATSNDANYEQMKNENERHKPADVKESINWIINYEVKTYKK